MEIGKKINSYGSILDQVIGQKLNQFIAPKQNKGCLLNFVSSPYGRDISSGLLAQSQYTTMPTSLGASVGTAVQNAGKLQTARRANDLSELGTMVNLADSLKSKTTNPNSYKEYLLTDNTPTNEEYKIFLDRNKTIPKAETPRSYQTENGDVLTITDSEFNRLDPILRQKLIPFKTTATRS